jgi:hypothetical protein
MHIARFSRLIEVMLIQQQKALAIEAAHDKGAAPDADKPELYMMSWLADEVSGEWLNGPVDPALQKVVEDNGFNRPAVYLKHGFCGTTACMAGYGAMDEQLSRQGLRIAMLGTAYTRTPFVVFEDKMGYEALAAFFDIPKHHAEMLFGDGPTASRFRRAREFAGFTKAAALLKSYQDDPETLFREYLDTP